ncbi:MAG: COG2426 family protein [Peptoniphilaceae bacterium]
MNYIAEKLSTILSKELAIFFISMLPLAEMKLAIPIGISLDMHWFKCFSISYIGSLIPSIFIVYYIRHVFNFLKSRNILKNTISHLVKKSHIKYEKAIKFKKFGLFLLVAIPLPGTGVWSASLIANIVNLNKKTSILIIALGNFVSGLLLSYFSGLIFL